jgi:hypothetical protein
MFDVCIVSSQEAHWEQQWSYLLSHFKPRDIYVIGAELERRVKPFTDYIHIQTAEEIKNTLVLLAPQSGRYVQGEVSLRGFPHPQDCCYMFGNDHTNMSEDYLGTRKPEHLVYIPTETTDQMYSFMAGAITLWDRELYHG